jgi:hypothetical protein
MFEKDRSCTCRLIRIFRPAPGQDKVPKVQNVGKHAHGSVAITKSVERWIELAVENMGSVKIFHKIARFMIISQQYIG